MYIDKLAAKWQNQLITLPSASEIVGDERARQLSIENSVLSIEKDRENDNANNPNMSENLGRIRAVREGNRGVITKLIKKAEFHINQLNESQQGKYDIGRMKTICSILSEKKDILKLLDEKIVSLCEVEEIA